MSITKRQFTQLQAMGIPLWQLNSTAENIDSTTVDYLDIELSSLTKTRIFIDILSSLGLSVGEVSCNDNALSLGFMTWQFSHQTDVTYSEHHLVTPPLDVLKNSPKLKQTLWRTLQEQALI